MKIERIVNLITLAIKVIMKLLKIQNFVVNWTVSTIGFIWSHTFGLYQSKSRIFVGKSAAYWKPRKQIFKSIKTIDFIPNDSVISLRSIGFRSEANVTTDELASLCWIAQKIEAQYMFEIGTFDGRTSRNLVANVPCVKQLVTLDLPLEAVNNTALTLPGSERPYVGLAQSGERFKNTSEGGKIKLVLTDSAQYKPDETELGHYQFIFIDGAHNLDYVISDSELALRLVDKNKGVIIWHDCDLPDVEEGIERFCHEHGLPMAESISATRIALVCFVNNQASSIAESIK